MFLEDNKLMPRGYQASIVDMICKYSDYWGRIISLETGLGKTFIALLVLCQKLRIDYEKESIKNSSIKRLEYA